MNRRTLIQTAAATLAIAALPKNTFAAPTGIHKEESSIFDGASTLATRFIHLTPKVEFNEAMGYFELESSVAGYESVESATEAFASMVEATDNSATQGVEKIVPINVFAIERDPSGDEWLGDRSAVFTSTSFMSTVQDGHVIIIQTGNLVHFWWTYSFQVANVSDITFELAETVFSRNEALVSDSLLDYLPTVDDVAVFGQVNLTGEKEESL